MGKFIWPGGVGAWGDGDTGVRDWEGIVLGAETGVGERDGKEGGETFAEGEMEKGGDGSAGGEEGGVGPLKGGPGGAGDLAILGEAATSQSGESEEGGFGAADKERVGEECVLAAEVEDGKAGEMVEEGLEEFGVGGDNDGDVRDENTGISTEGTMDPVWKSVYGEDTGSAGRRLDGLGETGKGCFDWGVDGEVGVVEDLLFVGDDGVEDVTGIAGGGKVNLGAEGDHGGDSGRTNERAFRTAGWSEETWDWMARETAWRMALGSRERERRRGAQRIPGDWRVGRYPHIWEGGTGSQV
jgi:hypothetical protein